MSYKIKFVFLTLMVMAFSVVTSAQSPNSKALSAEFDKLLSAQFKPGETGCAALVAINGQIIYKPKDVLRGWRLRLSIIPMSYKRNGS